jgi:hypothetical protein
MRFFPCPEPVGPEPLSDFSIFPDPVFCENERVVITIDFEWLPAFMLRTTVWSLTYFFMWMSDITSSKKCYAQSYPHAEFLAHPGEIITNKTAFASVTPPSKTSQ